MPAQRIRHCIASGSEDKYLSPVTKKVWLGPWPVLARDYSASHEGSAKAHLTIPVRGERPNHDVGTCVYVNCIENA